MPKRRPYIAGNWKMHKTAAEAKSFVTRLLETLSADSGRVEVGLCVPFTAISAAVSAAEGTELRIAAQNMHYQPEGPYTGEISAPMLTAAGASAVVVGHSERRQYFCETDEAVGEKVTASLAASLQPILCVGETDDERAAGHTEDRLRTQVSHALAGVDAERVSQVVIAYEPVWAIGTGNVATSVQAQDAIAFIRSVVAERFDRSADTVRILYGGSVKAESAAEILAEPDVDGALVGGASLDPDEFAEIVRAA